MKKHKEECGGVLPFDFWEEEKRLRLEAFSRKVSELKTYEDPENENEELFNLQKRYYEGETKVIEKMFILLQAVAARLVNIEMHSRKRLRFTQERINELATDSAALVIEQIQKNKLMVKNSFIAYLRLQVLKVMYGQTKGERFERYCIQNRLDIFSFDEEQKRALKKEFESKEALKTNDNGGDY